MNAGPATHLSILGNELEATEPTLIFLIRLTIRKWGKACNEAIAACCAGSFATWH